MNDQNKDNTGVLFKNDRKDTETKPDYTGSWTMGGREYFLSAWINETKQGGSKYMSVKLGDLKEKQPTAQPAPAQPSRDAGEFDDDIPF